MESANGAARATQEVFMLAKLKAIPVVPKILIGAVLLLGVYKVSHIRHHSATNYNFEPAGPVSEDTGTTDERAGNGQAPARGTSEAAMAQQELAQFQQQYAELSAKAQSCMVQMNQAAVTNANAIMNGQAPGEPACTQYMPQWEAQAAYLETEIYRLQTGDTHTSMRQIVGMPAGQSGSSGGSGTASYYRPSGPGNDGGIGAVENATRQGIRGNSLYYEPDGTEHELPTAPYYYRNQNSGQIFSSEQSTPPNDGSPYEQLTPQNEN